nr:MAG TPA: hypothetical protein [Caudoviricetes sp.]
MKILDLYCKAGGGRLSDMPPPGSRLSASILRINRIIRTNLSKWTRSSF